MKYWFVWIDNLAQSLSWGVVKKRKSKVCENLLLKDYDEKDGTPPCKKIEEKKWKRENYCELKFVKGAKRNGVLNESCLNE